MKPLHKLSGWVLAGVWLCAASAFAQQPDSSSAPAHEEASPVNQEASPTTKEPSPPNTAPLTEQVQDLKAAALALNRDLLILEEELLFPANSQIAVFVSLDVGEYFRLDAIKLEIDDQLVASHLYTDRQNDSLSRGGIQRLYVGNLTSGSHELTAVFTGLGPEEREYKRAATTTIEKGQQPHMLEIRVKDSTATMQPEFDFKEWQL